MKKILIPLFIFFALVACQLSDLTATQTGTGVDLNLTSESLAISQSQAQTAIVQTQIALSVLSRAQQSTQAALLQTVAAQDVLSQSQQETQDALDQSYRELEKTLTAIVQTQSSESTATAAYANNQASMTQTAFVMTTTAEAAGIGTDFTGATIYAWGQWTASTYGMTIQLMDKVRKEQFFLDIGNKTFKCTVLEKYPKRLYCSGKPVPGGSYTVQVYYLEANGQKKVVFTQEYALPKWTPTPSPSPVATKTP
jgi:hypothetical protein